MIRFLFLFFISTSVFSQQTKDSIITVKIDSLTIAKDSILKPIQQELYTDKDLQIIDSLIVEDKFNSSLIDLIAWFMVGLGVT